MQRTKLPNLRVPEGYQALLCFATVGAYPSGYGDTRLRLAFCILPAPQMFLRANCMPPNPLLVWLASDIAGEPAAKAHARTLLSSQECHHSYCNMDGITRGTSESCLADTSQSVVVFPCCLWCGRRVVGANVGT